MLRYIQLLSLFLVTIASCETIINIDSSTTSGNQSLYYHLCTSPGELQSNTVIILSPGVYFLDEGPSCIITGINNLSIQGSATGNSSDVAELHCVSDFLGGNLIFVNITNLHLENLVIINCGQYIPEDLPAYATDNSIGQFGKNQKVVLMFAQVVNLHVEDVIMARNYGYGIIGINLQGDTRLNHVHILSTDNTRHPLCFGFENDLRCVGSGAFFLYSDSTSNNSTTVSNGSLVISNCIFDHNQYVIPLAQYLAIYSVARSPFQTVKVTLIGGTGVTIFTGQRSYFLDVQILNSTFTDNVGETSSLVFVPFNSIRDSTFLVDNCSFHNNIARAPGRGGGLVLLVLLFVDALASFPEYPDSVHTMLSITNSDFEDNKAFIGGAIYLHMSPQNVTKYQVKLDGVSFIRNVASVGSAISANSIPTLFTPQSSELFLEDVTVMNNTFPSTLLTTTSTIDNSAALVFSIINNVTISGRNDSNGSLFSHNSPGAVLVSGGKLFLRGHVKFSDNLAFRGGALALFDYTLLHIHEGSRIQFSRNHALQTGGAIFANSLGTGILDVCVFQIVGTHRVSTADEVGLLDLKLKFEGNSAGVAGNSIYANPLYNCAYLPEASTVQNEFDYRVQDIYDAIFDFESSVTNGNEEVTSLPERISFCNPSDPTSLSVELRTNITTIPGKQFSFYLIPLDLIFTRVQSVMFAELDNPALSFGLAQSTQTLDGNNCSLIYFNIYGPENSQTNMFLYARLGGVGLTVEVTVGECPRGFLLVSVNELQQCYCDGYVTEAIQTTCNTSTYTIARRGNIWIGSVDNTEHNVSSVVWVNTCPIGHCDPKRDNIDLHVIDQICVPGRSGVLCGKCQDGLSIVFGTSNCQVCSNYWLFTILLYAAAGIMIVIVLFLLDLTVTQGTINGLIFYVNVVSVNGGIFFESKASFVRVFVSLLNLELGFPICFYDGMNEAAKIGLQFVFPVYLMILCLVLILLSRWSSRIQKLTSSSGIAVLATLFYLSYGKLLRTVIDCLSSATVKSKLGDQTIWLYDGNLTFFQSVHIILGLVAFVVTVVFLIPYTLPLVFIKQVDRHSIRLKPLFDAYAGPYKDRYRYWFGIRLLLLIAVCMTYAIAGTDYQSLALTLETFFIMCFTVWQAYAKPYKNRAIGILDLFFLLNFLIMAIWLLHLFDDDAPLAMPKKVGMTTFLVSLAFIAALGILVYHILRTLYLSIPKMREKTDKIWTSIHSVHWYQRYKHFKHMMNRKGSQAVDMTNAHELSTTQPVVTHTEVYLDGSVAVEMRKETFSQLREPVLDFPD